MSQVEETFTSYISTEKAETIFDNRLMHERTRQHFNTLIGEYVEKQDFVDLVKKYADETMDEKIFKNFSLWVKAACGVIGTSVLSGLVARYWR